MNESDFELLNAIRLGDTDALDTFLARYTQQVSRYIELLCDDEEVAAEILSETFSRFFRLEQMTEGHTLTHLLTLADTSVTLWIESSVGTPALEAVIADESASDEMLLFETMKRLPREYQQVLVLKDVLRLEVTQAASVMNLEAIEFQSLLRRSRRMLKRGFFRRLRPTEQATPHARVPQSEEGDSLVQ